MVSKKRILLVHWYNILTLNEKYAKVFKDFICWMAKFFVILHLIDKRSSKKKERPSPVYILKIWHSVDLGTFLDNLKRKIYGTPAYIRKIFLLLHTSKHSPPLIKSLGYFWLPLYNTDGRCEGVWLYISWYTINLCIKETWI